MDFNSPRGQMGSTMDDFDAINIHQYKRVYEILRSNTVITESQTNQKNGRIVFHINLLIFIYKKTFILKV